MYINLFCFQDGGDDNEEGEGGDKRSTRPTTARRRPPKVKDGAKELQSKDVAPAVKKTEGIIIDGQADEVRACVHVLFCFLSNGFASLQIFHSFVFCVPLWWVAFTHFKSSLRLL